MPPVSLPIVAVELHVVCIDGQSAFETFAGFLLQVHTIVDVSVLQCRMKHLQVLRCYEAQTHSKSSHIFTSSGYEKSVFQKKNGAIPSPKLTAPYGLWIWIVGFVSFNPLVLHNSPSPTTNNQPP